MVGRVDNDNTTQSNCYDLNGIYSLMLTCNNNTYTQLITYGSEMCKAEFLKYQATVDQDESQSKIENSNLFKGTSQDLVSVTANEGRRLQSVPADPYAEGGDEGGDDSPH